MKLKRLPTESLLPQTLQDMLTSGACTVLLMIRCVACDGAGEVKGFECSVCDGAGHEPYLAPPAELFRAIAGTASALNSQMVAVLRSINCATPEDSAGIKPWNDESEHALAQAIFLEQRMVCCFQCGYRLQPWKHAPERKWCSRCEWLVSEIMMVYLTDQASEETMAIDITELVGEKYMSIAYKAEVIALLQNLPTNATTKRYLFGRWARVLGFQPSKEDLNSVAPWSQ